MSKEFCQSMQVFAEQTQAHRRRPNWLRTVKSFFEFTRDSLTMTPAYGTRVGMFQVEHEYLPQPLTDPKTGFTVNSGILTILHLDVGKLARKDKSLAVSSMRSLANYVTQAHQGESLPEYILGATNINLARAAIQLGFRYLKPDPRIFTDYYRYCVHNTKSTTIPIPDIREPVALVYMPINDLVQTYGDQGWPNEQSVRKLASIARSETLLVRQTGQVATVLARASEEHQ